MANNEICSARKEATALMCKSFYTDFMPMIEHIKNDLSTLNVSEQNKEVINNINEELKKAESLLKQIKKFSDNTEYK